MEWYLLRCEPQQMTQPGGVPWLYQGSPSCWPGVMLSGHGCSSYLACGIQIWEALSPPSGCLISRENFRAWGSLSSNLWWWWSVPCYAYKVYVHMWAHRKKKLQWQYMKQWLEASGRLWNSAWWTVVPKSKFCGLKICKDFHIAFHKMIRTLTSGAMQEAWRTMQPSLCGDGITRAGFG